MNRSRPEARILMCRPEHFGVTYIINPWMDPQRWTRDENALAATSHREWAALHRTLIEAGAQVDLIPPVPGLPDLVFTANSAVVLDGKALLSRFRHPQRRAEEAPVEAAFRRLQGSGLIDSIRKLPDGLVLEGAGDCVWDQTRNLFWMGYGPRSDAAARAVVEQEFGATVVALELADPRFYHMDTALCPLTRGEVIYYPDAFTEAGRATIRERVAPAHRIEIGIDDARRLAANAVCIGDTVLLSGCSLAVKAAIEARGYRVTATPLGSFLRSGGGAFCLTLRLDRRSAEARAAVGESAA
ncbi:MAG: amidinotransferase [Rhizobiales bacterium]|nr:amidinotransferase [Hyphomicrobiales bacterium]